MIEFFLELIVTPILHAIGMALNVIFWSFCWLIVGVARAFVAVGRAILSLGKR